ncbi:MAG: LPS assembly protein LptD, partial [bacterium]
NLGQSSLPYQRLPRAHFVYSPWMKQSWIQPDLQVDTVHFRRIGYDSATRSDIYPSLTLYWQKPWAYAKLKAGQRYTQYQLEDASPKRSIPIVSIDSGGYFDRDFKWANKSWQQTLEPRLFYLNIPYRDQQDIPRFDTSEMDFSFSQLFSENRFSGGDRQMDANQLTAAITSRVLSASGEEKLSLKAGQIFYFDSPRVGLNDDLNIEQSKSASVLEAAYKFSNQWTVSASNQWDQLENTSDKTTFRVRGPFAGKGFASLSYRYRRGQLEQVDSSVFWPINQRWHALARWNYSLKDKQNLETVAGVAYQSCCWSVRLVGRRYALDDRDAQLVQKTSFYLELNLTGLGSFGSGGQNIVERAIYGYTEFD